MYKMCAYMYICVRVYTACTCTYMYIVVARTVLTHTCTHTHTHLQGEHVADLMLGSQPCPTVEEYRRNMADLITRGVNSLTEIQNVHVHVHVCNTFT